MGKAKKAKMLDKVLQTLDDSVDENNESVSINNENIDDDKSKKGMDSPEFLAYFEQFILDMIYLMIKTRMMKMMTMTMMKKIWNMQLAQRDHIEFNHHICIFLFFLFFCVECFCLQ